MGGSYLKIILTDLNLFQLHERVSSLRSIAKGLIENTPREVYERYDIECDYSSYVGAPPVIHKTYSLYISELTEYERDILKDLGYAVYYMRFDKRDWSKKLNLK